MLLKDSLYSISDLDLWPLNLKFAPPVTRIHGFISPNSKWPWLINYE